MCIGYMIRDRTKNSDRGGPVNILGHAILLEDVKIQPAHPP